MDRDKNTAKILNKLQLNYWRLDLCFLPFWSLFKILNDSEIASLIDICELDKNTLELLDNTIPVKTDLINPYPLNIYSHRFVRITPQLWLSFKQFAIELDSNLSQKMIIKSGYRSPAYQSLLFLKEYYASKFDIKQTKKVILTPGKSEHQIIDKLAIDIIIGKSSKVTPNVYRWLSDNAAKYNFINSYDNNTDRTGMIFEPWHWSFRPDNVLK